VHAQPPAVDLAQIDLLPILVIPVLGTLFAVDEILIEIASLRERSAVQEPLAVPPCRGCDDRAVAGRPRPLQVRRNSS